MDNLYTHKLFYIYDCNNTIQGNKKGYKNHRRAMQVALGYGKYNVNKTALLLQEIFDTRSDKSEFTIFSIK